ncbi:MAG: outer membrane protein assembly factor BamD [Holosporaceae bacterium]|nr:MAG: outer membrane protein assembly factor BamD [Holosporaceae bacterium]
METWKLVAFYQRQNLPIAALGRFQEVVKRYDRSTHTPEALYRLVELNLNLGILKEAQASAAVLGHNYPKINGIKKHTNFLKTPTNSLKLIIR